MYICIYMYIYVYIYIYTHIHIYKLYSEEAKYVFLLFYSLYLFGINLLSGFVCSCVLCIYNMYIKCMYIYECMNTYMYIYINRWIDR